MLDLIAFDADDTLWHNERYYLHGRQKFHELLSNYDVDVDIDERLDEIEIHNLRYYGYGAMGFVLSMIETAVHLTDGRFATDHIQALLTLGKAMLSHEVELFDQVKETLQSLSANYPLMVITKGDLRHQKAKFDQSGLNGLFGSVEVVSDKSPQVYADILARYQVPASRFLMVGNSLRSDIMPVVEIGGKAIYIANSLTWTHEDVPPPANEHPNYFVLDRISEVPELIENLRFFENS